MRVTFELAFRVCCLAAGLLLAGAEAAEPVSPLIGNTRQQVLSRYGEPRSQISFGDRLVFLYPRERVIFRGDVVVEVEAIVPEPVRRPPGEETPTPGPETTEPGAAATPASSTPGTAPAVPGPAPTPRSTPETSSPPPPSEPKLEIKLVRPPGSKDLPPIPVTTPSPAPPPATAGPPRVTVREEPAPKAAPPTPPPIQAETNEARRAAERAAAAEKEQKARAMKEARRRLDEAARDESAPTEGFSVRTWLMVAGGLAAVASVVYWLSRRRPVELEDVATAVAGAGVAPGFGVSNGNSFTPEMIEDLDWNRFEQLVVSYYSKTGVVAAPTRAGPDAPVQIKISWKGEPRPFAYVRCVTNSAGLVDVKPLRELEAALAADDIRRGYVVTTGRFTPAARGLAAEQQLTLLPGDTLVEKLNALPEGARRELLREISPS